ncbi:MAG: hypothetical protein ABR572_06915 [Cryomorphaceae bacterium]|nr:hypothetical protein [Flavobacteriales bacterium]
MTNLLILFLSVFLVAKMRGLQGSWIAKWRMFLLCLGIASFGGIFTHGLPLLFTEEEFYLVWGLKNSFVPIGNFFASVALIPFITNRKNDGRRVRGRKLWSVFFAAKAMAVIFLLFYTRTFIPAVVDLAVTYFLAIVATVGMRGYIPGASVLLAAFLTAVVSGFMYLTPWHFDPHWFTNSDAVHIMVLVSMVLIYKGACEAAPHFESVKA